MKRFSVLMIVLVIGACIGRPNDQPPPRASLSDYYRALAKAERMKCRITHTVDGKPLIHCIDPADPHFAGFDFVRAGYTN